MVVHSLARNFLIIGDAPGLRFHASRPVSMAGANAVHVSTTVTRANAPMLTAWVEGVDDPDKAWHVIGTALDMTSGTAAFSAVTFTVATGWVRLAVNWAGMTLGTQQAVFDIDLNTCLL